MMLDAIDNAVTSDEVLLDEARTKLAALQQQLIMQSSSGSDALNNNNKGGGASDDQEQAGMDVSATEAESCDDDGEQGDGEELNNDEVTEIQTQINMQQQLIERLEMSQKQMAAMRLQYEAKVGQLQAKIRETEAERDRVLSTIERSEAQTKDKSDHLRTEYEAKINQLQHELKKVQQAAREQQRFQAKQLENQRKLEQMKNELQSMKQAKTSLVRRLRDEAVRQRKADAEKNREIAQLKRQQQQKDSMIMRLENEKRLREVVAKRQLEEAESFRRQHRNYQRMRAISAKSAASSKSNTTTNEPSGAGQSSNNTTVQLSAVPEPTFSNDECEELWNIFIQRLTHLIAGRSLLNRTDCELKRLLGERETLNQRLQRYLKQKGHVTSSPMARDRGAVIADLETQIDNLKANIRYNEDSIEECQRRIIQLVSPQQDEDEQAEGGARQPNLRDSDVQNLFDGDIDLKRILTGSGCRSGAVVRSTAALRFVVEKLLNAFITQGVSLSRLESSSSASSSAMNNKNVADGKGKSVMNGNNDGDSVDLVPTSDRVPSIEITTTPQKQKVPPVVDPQETPKALLNNDSSFLAVSARSAKARRWSATSQELLFGRTPSRDATLAQQSTQNNQDALSTLVEAELESDTSQKHQLSRNDVL